MIDLQSSGSGIPTAISIVPTFVCSLSMKICRARLNLQSSLFHNWVIFLLISASLGNCIIAETVLFNIFIGSHLLARENNNKSSTNLVK